MYRFSNRFTACRALPSLSANSRVRLRTNIHFPPIRCSRSAPPRAERNVSSKQSVLRNRFTQFHMVRLLPSIHCSPMHDTRPNAPILSVFHSQTTNETILQVQRAGTARATVWFLSAFFPLVAQQTFFPLERLAAGTTRIYCSWNM